MRHSHATHDLVNHIADGEFPEWDFCIQTMDLSEEHSQDFDPLDCTKVGTQSWASKQCLSFQPNVMHPGTRPVCHTCLFDTMWKVLMSRGSSCTAEAALLCVFTYDTV